MNSKIQAILIITLLAVILLGSFYYFSSRGAKIKDTDTSVDSNIQTKENFTLTTEYLGDSRWKYTITGQLPNPCYKTSVESIVKESYPEQVSIVLTVEKPAEDIMCAQVIKDYEYLGEFTASEKAITTLEVQQ